MNIEQVICFFAWCAIINIGILLFSTLSIIIFREQISVIHGKLFKLDASTLPKAYFKYLAYYKIIILSFNVAPYFALVLMQGST